MVSTEQVGHGHNIYINDEIWAKLTQVCEATKKSYSHWVNKILGDYLHVEC